MEIGDYRLIVGWPTLVSVLLIVGLLAVALRNPWLRSWRTVAAAILALIVIVVALAVPVIPRVIIRSAAVGFFALAIMFEDRRLWSLRRGDGDFAAAWRSVLAKVPALLRRSESLHLAEYLHEFAAVADDLARLPAPSEDWRQLRDDTVAHLSRQVTRLRLGVLPTDDEIRIAEDQSRAFQAQLRRLFDTKRSFWLPWP